MVRSWGVFSKRVLRVVDKVSGSDERLRVVWKRWPQPDGRQKGGQEQVDGHKGRDWRR
jgi:hypothetical protein